MTSRLHEPLILTTRRSHRMELLAALVIGAGLALLASMFLQDREHSENYHRTAVKENR